MPSKSIPVLIVGAGPTGLNLANLLTQYQIPHRIIDQKLSPIPTSNALVVQARSLEMWQSMGLAENAIARGKKIFGLSLNSLTRSIGEINFANAGLATQFPFILGLPQSTSESILAEALERKGGNIERGVSLIDLTQVDGATVQLQHASGEIETVICDWLVAADGCHSLIRKKLGLEFRGQVIPEKFIMMDAEISADLDPDYFHVTLSAFGPLVFAPLPDFTRIISSVTHDSGIKDFNNPTIADFEYIIKQRSRFPVRINKSRWISHFVTQRRLIDNYRCGHVLFAGDSAHVHSPVGGQGMNTGMQDTFNLAWKLAWTIKGKSGVKLLDTYDIERRRVAKKVLASTTKMTSLIAVKIPLLIAFRNALMLFVLRYQAIQRMIANNISELGINYAPNSIISQGGKRAPDALLYDINKQVLSIRQLFGGLKHKVLIFTGKNYLPSRVRQIFEMIGWINENCYELFEAIIVSTGSDDFDNLPLYLDESAVAHRSYSLLKGGICVVRPDQYIGLCHTQISCEVLSKYLTAISGR